MKWFYLFLFIGLNYALSIQLMSSQLDSLADAALIILMLLLGLIVKVRSRKNHPRIYAFAWGMVYGNVISIFLLAGFWAVMYLKP